MQAWAGNDEAESSNDTYENIDITSKDYTDWLRCTAFGFAIDEGDTLDGITVEIEHYGEGGVIEEHSCRLVLDGVVKGDEKMTLTNAIPDADADTYESYGGAADDWNSGLSIANINNALFGVQVSYYNDHNTQNRNVYVDHIRITINHTTPGGNAATRAIGRGILRGVYS